MLSTKSRQSSQEWPPLLLHPLPELQDALGWLWALSKLPLEVLPELLNWIVVWRLYWPWHDIDLMVFEPVLGLLACVLWVIVLLEGDL